MIMRLWVGNDVNPSCLLHSPPPAYQILNMGSTKSGSAVLPQINVIRSISKHIKNEFKGPNGRYSRYSSMLPSVSGPRGDATRGRWRRWRRRWRRRLSTWKCLNPSRAVDQTAVKERNAESTDECLRDRCLKWPWYITLSFRDGAMKISGVLLQSALVCIHSLWPLAWAHLQLYNPVSS